MSNHFLLVDIGNIFHRVFFVHRGDPDFIGLTLHSTLMTLYSLYQKYKPDKIVLAFDRPSWRKDYTASEKCISKKLYKGNRRSKMTGAEWGDYNRLVKCMHDFEEAVANYASIICLSGDGLEADDLIAGFVQEYHKDNIITLISSDKDFLQLLRYTNVSMIDPGTQKEKTLVGWNNDAAYFLFEKCLRGEIGDNVQSAFPRVRKTRIQKAYTDSYEYANLMNEVWKNHEGKEFVVKHLYEENRLLMDLSMQPQEIRDQIIAVVNDAMTKITKFSLFHFLRFCGIYQLKKITAQIDQYIPMLSC